MLKFSDVATVADPAMLPEWQRELRSSCLQAATRPPRAPATLVAVQKNHN